MNTSWIIALFAMLLVAGCKPKQIEVSGQVFIATAGGATVRLGAVEVQLINRDEVTNFVQERTAFFRSQQVLYREAVESAERDLAEAQNQYDLARADTSYKTNTDYLKAKADLERTGEEIASLTQGVDALRTRNAQLQTAATNAHSRAALEANWRDRTAITQRNYAALMALEAKAAAIFESRAETLAAWAAVEARLEAPRGQVGQPRPPAQPQPRPPAQPRPPGNAVPGPPEPKEFADWRVFLDAAPQPLQKLTGQIAEKRSGATVLQSKIDAIELGKSREAKQTLDTCKLRFDEANRDLARTGPARQDFFAVFNPTVVQKVNTDADGSFSLSYPANKPFAIFARAQRTVPSIGRPTQEHYCWLIDAPTKTGPARILLNNNSLVEIDPDGYLKGKPN